MSLLTSTKRLLIETYVGDLIRFLVGKNTSFPIFSGPLKGKKWILGAANIHHILGIFKEERMDKFDELITESSVIYDVGAQGGWYTLLASELTGPDGKVIAFEPLPLNVQYLRRHIEMNHCSNVQIIEVAVSDRDGQETFFATKDGKLGAISAGGLGHEYRWTVSAVTLDSLVKSRAIPPPDFVKINIEGGEFLALKGAEYTLTTFAPTIFLAIHSYDLGVACCNFLTAKSYNLDKISAHKFHTAEFVAHKN